MIHCRPILDKEIEGNTSSREHEVKLGGVITHPGKEVSLDRLKIANQYVVIGIPESIGPRANCGTGGAELGWKAFLKTFLNIQVNEFLPAEQITLLGTVAVDDLQESSEGENDLKKLRELTSKLDDRVEEVIHWVKQRGGLPIVIGGGHNNAYPLLKACSKNSDVPLACCNLDPHADFRMLEGRHSGNGFSYAKAEGYLSDYLPFGLHELYNSATMLEEMRRQEVPFQMMDLQAPFVDQIQHAYNQCKSWDKPIGIELDMDSIAHMPVSAFTPVGLSMMDARRYVQQMAKLSKIQYLHLPEAAPTSPLEEKIVGKALTYLVTDFIRTHASKN